MALQGGREQRRIERRWPELHAFRAAQRPICCAPSFIC